ncbi:hypothetical protein PG990_001849 [Apiospora arundinis]
MPVSWVPPSTNSKGTQVWAVTYSVSENVDITSVIPLRPTPQFQQGEEFNFSKGTYGYTKSLFDPKGLFALPVWVYWWGSFQLEALESILPGLP